MSRSDAPVWTLVAIVALWVVFLVTWPGTDYAASEQSMLAIAGLSVLVSLPIIYYDAKQAVAAGQLEVDYPIAVPIAVLLFWLLTAPAYALYRGVKQYQSGESPTPAVDDA